MQPSAQVASYIDAQMLKNSAPDPTKMAKVIKDFSRTTFTLPLGDKGHNALVQDGDFAFFDTIRRKFPSVFINFGHAPGGKEDRKNLIVTCPAAMEAAIKRRINRRLEDLGEEDIILPIPPESSKNIGKFIKVKQELQKELSVELDKSLGEVENDNRKQLEGKEGKGQWIKVERWDAATNSWDGETKGAAGPFRVRIRMAGRARALKSSVVGRVRAKLIETLGLEQNLQWSSAAGGDSMDMNMLNPETASGAEVAADGQGVSSGFQKRQMLLRTPNKPPNPKNKDQALLMIAHTAIWDADGCVYGGEYAASPIASPIATRSICEAPPTPHPPPPTPLPLLCTPTCDSNSCAQASCVTGSFVARQQMTWTRWWTMCRKGRSKSRLCSHATASCAYRRNQRARRTRSASTSRVKRSKWIWSTPGHSPRRRLASTATWATLPLTRTGCA